MTKRYSNLKNERDQALLSNVTQQHSEDREDDVETSFTRAQFAALVKETVQERKVDMHSHHVFLGVEGMYPKSKSLRTRNLTDEERRRGANKKRPFKVVSEDCKRVVLASKRVKKYLRCSPDLVITWSTQSDGTANWKLTGSVDASFANCQIHDSVVS
jgi:hypothetical protein